MRLTLFQKADGEVTTIFREVARDEQAAKIVGEIRDSSKVVACELTDLRGVRCAWALTKTRNPSLKITLKSERYRGDWMD